MGEISRAYDILNKTLKLGLTSTQVMVAEAAYKIDFGTRMKFPRTALAQPTTFSADWEVQTTLVPRKTALRSRTKKSFEELKQEAQSSK